MARPRKARSHNAPQASTSKSASSGKAKAKASTSSEGKSSKKKSKNSKNLRSKSRRVRGQKGIDSARAMQIQQALIRENYLDGEPTGAWDQRTKDAMTRYQADHGWQTKVLPDSRALIKLGLGPDHSKLINPATAATPSPAVSVAGRQQ